MKQPVIGITLDYENNQKYSVLPYYALRENYVNAVVKQGGIPILLPFDLESVNKYLDIIDGLIVTGGHFDISPELYGDKTMHQNTSLKENRTKFEYKICSAAMERNIPILAICGGMQLINVILGGSLIQDIADYIEDAIPHEVRPYNKAAHDVKIVRNSKLYHLANNKSNVGVNSSHHQAILKLGDNLISSGTTQDGVIEAIEHKEYPFLIGVQWHPEYEISDLDRNLFSGLIAASM